MISVNMQLLPKVSPTAIPTATPNSPPTPPPTINCNAMHNYTNLVY